MTPTDRVDDQIRDALQAEANAIDVPEDLAAKTFQRIDDEPSSPMASLRARREAKKAGLATGPGRLSRTLVGTAAAAVFALMFAVVGGGAQLALPPIGGADTTLSERQDGFAEFAPDGGGVTPEGVGPSVHSGPATPSRPRTDTRPDLPQGQVDTAGPHIVRTASVEVRVDRGTFDEAWDQANSVAATYDGFVTVSEARTVGDRLNRGSLRIRVPADRLDAALADLRDLGTLVRQSSSAADVSDQLVDMDARLRSLRVQEDQYLELMREAQSISEILEVRSRLDEVRTRIESLAGQRDNLQANVAMSTIDATIYEPDAEPTAAGSGNRFGEILGRAGDTLFAVVSGMIIVASGLAPLFAVALIGWLAIRVVRARLT